MHQGFVGMMMDKCAKLAIINDDEELECETLVSSARELGHLIPTPHFKPPRLPECRQLALGNRTPTMEATMENIVDVQWMHCTSGSDGLLQAHDGPDRRPD